jgi:hypothetical protein
MANAGSFYTNTAVHQHGTEYDGWHEPLESPMAAPVAAVQMRPRTPPRRPASEYEAAVMIARWVERRFDQVFWRCHRCDRESPYATAHYHAYVSNFGICHSCHNETLHDDLQSESDDWDRGRTPSDPDYSGYSTGGSLRWVGPRHTRERRRIEAMHNRRLDQDPGRFAIHKEQFDRFHEELMAKAWHPSRVSHWLEQGEDVLDMMMGV